MELLILHNSNIELLITLMRQVDTEHLCLHVTLHFSLWRAQDTSGHCKQMLKHVRWSR